MKRLAFPILVGLAGAIVLAGLGVWQLQRLNWKTALLAEIEARISEPPVAVPAEPDPEADRFLPVTVTGQYAGQPLRVLVSVKLYGAGHRLISAFQTDDGRRILVDRGYLRLGDESVTPSEPRTIVGNLHWPADADSYTPSPDGDLWFARDVDAMAQVLDAEPIMIIARNLSPADNGVTPLPVDTSRIPNDHLEYAITWFSLCAIWLLMTGFWVRRSRAQPSNGAIE